jgi:hypothetical protein
VKKCSSPAPEEAIVRLKNLLVFIPMIALGACASAPPRPAELAAAREKIDSAEAVFARADVRSALYLDLASQELGHARAALSQNDVVAARAWAKQASADAEMARSVALEIQAQSEAQQGWDEVHKLQEQLARPVPPTSRSLPSSP